MPQSMSKTQIQRFTRICEDQGIRVTKTKKGLLLRFPDGSSTVQHFTNSDVRAEQNQIARFRRAGMVHPNDTRAQQEELPSYITSGTISDKTRQRIVDYVVSQGFPEAVLSSSVVRDLKMDPGWANRALYHSGFRPGKAKSRKVGRPWYTPDEILCLKESPQLREELDQIVDDEETLRVPAEVDHMPIYDEPEPVTEESEVSPEQEAEILDSIEKPDFVEVERPKAPHVDFIDERDSWVIDPATLFGSKWQTFMKDELRVLKALGIEYEIRVWKTETE